MRKRPILFVSALALGAGIATIGAIATNQPATPRDYPDDLPFQVQTISAFEHPWALAMLPDGRMLVTQIEGRMFLVTPEGEQTEVSNVPQVAESGQLGLHDIAPAPDYTESAAVYLSYSAEAENPDDGTQIVLARAVLRQGDGSAHLSDLTEIWRQEQPSWGGHPGAIIAFDPEGTHVFMTVGDRQDTELAQDPAMARGKIIRLNLDGSVPEDNPWADAGGPQAQTWTTGHRNPYGLAFAADGTLWQHEMGPRGGDEINRIEPGLNYGWGVVSEGVNYDFSDIPNHDTQPEFEAPRFAWGTGTAPSGLAIHEGGMFADWEGSMFVGALAGMALIRVEMPAEGAPQEAERWDMHARIRDVAIGEDGAIWVIEDDNPGRLLRLIPN